MTSYYPDRRQYKRTASVLSLKYFLILFCLMPAAIALTSCEEKSTIIGSHLLPSGDFTSTASTDTISVFSYTYSVDSVRTNNKPYSYLGALYDPYFGTTKTGFVGQLRLLKDFKGGTDFQITSVKLYFTIAGAKGTLSTKQEIRLYEIGEQLRDTSYFSNRDPNDIKYFGAFEIPVIKKDSAMEVAVTLPVEIGQYLMRDTAILFQNNPLSDFRSFFKGLHVELTPTAYKKSYVKGSETDSLMLMALTFDQGDFVIRVTYQSPGVTGDQFYDFTINPNSVRYNLYSNDFNTADPGKKIRHLNDNVRDTLSYLQGFNGVYTKIKIPGLDTLRKLMPLSVNRAKLTIPVFLDGSLYKATTVPTKIYLRYLAADGVKYIVPDYQVNPAFFDGTYNSTKNYYTFNIASYLQYYLDPKMKIPAPELYLEFPEGEYKNVILKANHSVNKVRFEFTYTRF
jgi:hypothetical protein